MSTRKQNVIDEWKHELDQGINTTELQLQSLAYFLAELGYRLDSTEEVWHIVAEDPLTPFDSDCPTHMPFDTAVVLHNGTTWKTNGTIIEAKGFTFLRQTYKKAFDNKILHTVYLQRVKGGIKTQKHWVRFNEPYNLEEELERTY
tara:strand:- start:1782 stop:2216 length:435 start_codon:yes stop_codon:yes gene_type:complete